MQFYSLAFATFMFMALTMYYLFPMFIPSCQWIVLLFFSLVFYAFSGMQNLLFILITSLSTWFASLVFARLNDAYKQAKSAKQLDRNQLKHYKSSLDTKKRILLYTVTLFNLSILSFFKYVPSLFANALLFPFHSLLLPLGISFYTFQSLGYLIDTYHGKYKPQSSYPKYLLFVSYFPQLIQGPINRFDQLSTQFNHVHSFSIENTKRALLLFAFGALKKYAVSDLLAGNISIILDSTPPENIPGCISLFGILLYSIQQYADFSGGIDMVLGISQLFGIQMSPNFRQPYFATSLADFWRRWHISLGSWMRDYVFYPFALTKPMQRLTRALSRRCGKRLGGSITAGIANILVFFLVGIWHGPQLHYILWGLYNGIIIAISELLQPLFHHLSTQLHLPVHSKPFHVFRIVRTFLIVNIGWYFDRIENVSSCLIHLKNTFFHFSPSSIFMLLSAPQYAAVSLVSILLAIIGFSFVIIHSVLSEQKRDVYEYLHHKSIALRWLLYILIFFLIVLSFVFTTSQEKGFMYANF